MLTSWKTWCRLCANEKAMVKLESADVINAIISTQLQISISEFDDVPLSICGECYTFANKLERFKERCEQTNRLFNYLSNCSNIKMDECGVEEIRSRYLGMLDLDDVAERLREDFDAETHQLINIMPLNVVEDNEETGDLDDENQGIYFKVESLDTTIDHIDTHNSGTDTEQWEAPEELVYEDVKTGCYSDSESLDEKKDHSIDSGKPGKTLQSVEVVHDKFIRDSQTLPKLRRTQRGRPTNRRRAVLQCEICLKKFSSNSYLRKHEAAHLPNGEKQLFSCNFCDKMFSKAINVKAHIRMVHDGDKPFICEECGKPFGSKGALKEHYIVHTEERPYQCSYCPKSFKNAARLKTHEDIHNDTLYVCPHCGLKLNTKRTLNMHMVVHSDQKKYKCQYCGNEYKRSKALKAHLILHTGLRPYLCPFCDRTFANGSNCRSHKKKFHPNELAALEAAGGQKPATNIPKLAHLQKKSQSSIDETKSTEEAINTSSTEEAHIDSEQQKNDTKLKSNTRSAKRTSLRATETDSITS